MKILILRFSSIGDIVLTTPVIRILKTQLEAEVHYATKAIYESVILPNPYLDKVHFLDENGLQPLIAKLKDEGYDYIIDLHNNLRTRLIKWSLGKKSYSVHKLNFKKWLFVRFKINKLPNEHIVDRYVKTLAPLGCKMDNLGLDFTIPDRDIVEWDWLPSSHQQGFAAVVIGAKFKTKQLPTTRLIELCDRINKPVVLIGGKEDQEVGNEIEQFFRPLEDEKAIEALNKKTVVFNACGKFNLNQSASVIEKSSWVFTHDTGMMHIAAAFKKQIYSIWGNTVPQFGMYPYRTKFVIFENNKLDCRPCSKIGFNQCPKGHFKCMNNLTFDFYLQDY